jgi:hypothetical protein
MSESSEEGVGDSVLPELAVVSPLQRVRLRRTRIEGIQHSRRQVYSLLQALCEPDLRPLGNGASKEAARSTGDRCWLPNKKRFARGEKVKKSPLRQLIELYTHKLAFSEDVQEMDQLLRDFLEDALRLDLNADDIQPLNSVLPQ